MRNKNILLIVAIIVLVLIIISSLVFAGWMIVNNTNSRNNPPIPTVTPTPTPTKDPTVGQCTPENSEFSDDQITKLLKAYQDPYAKHIRVALDNYLSGDDSGLGGLVKKGIDVEGKTDGLDNFDKTYYSSKFVIFYVDNQAPAGGKNISIYFKDNYDRLFTAWVYKTGDGRYELRAFRDVGLTKEELEGEYKIPDCILTDERFGI